MALGGRSHHARVIVQVGACVKRDTSPRTIRLLATNEPTNCIAQPRQHCASQHLPTPPRALKARIQSCRNVSSTCCSHQSAYMVKEHGNDYVNELIMNQCTTAIGSMVSSWHQHFMFCRWTSRGIPMLQFARKQATPACNHWASEPEHGRRSSHRSLVRSSST